MQDIIKIVNLSVIIREGIIYPTPSNLNTFWAFGSLLICLIFTQIFSGILLAIQYIPCLEYTFNNVEYIIKNVSFDGWFIRYACSLGASLILFFLYKFISCYKIQIKYFMLKNILFVYYTKDSVKFKIAVFVLFIANMLLKILIWIAFPELFTFRGFIFMDLLGHSGIILMYFTRFLPYLLCVIGFHLPIYIWICVKYSTQVQFITKFEIIEFSWLFHNMSSPAGLSLYFSGIFFLFIYLSFG